MDSLSLTSMISCTCLDASGVRGVADTDNE